MLQVRKCVGLWSGLGLLGCAASLSAVPDAVPPESLPASVRACAAQPDPGQRLACYDREVARFAEATPRGGSVTAATAQETPGAVTSGPVIARVRSIEHPQSGLLLRLDNGQVWQEVQAVTGDLSLRVGDTVRIEKHLGAYWLTGPHVQGMSVRQKV